MPLQILGPGKVVVVLLLLVPVLLPLRRIQVGILAPSVGLTTCWVARQHVEPQVLLIAGIPVNDRRQLSGRRPPRRIRAASIHEFRVGLGIQPPHVVVAGVLVHSGVLVDSGTVLLDGNTVLPALACIVLLILGGAGLHRLLPEHRLIVCRPLTAVQRIVLPSVVWDKKPASLAAAAAHSMGWDVHQG